VLIANHYQRKFLEEYAKRLNVSVEDLEYSYFYELLALLEEGKDVDVEVFRKRKKFCFVVYTLDGYEVLTGDAVEYIFTELFKDSDENVTELSGTIASKGIARGAVRLVLKVDDVSKVESGDILVASMTRPEMVVAMKKAGAIVTDEGGITSHAAIVSRELRIPCVINTKNSTKVFKDGDMVEVDADKGVVRKI